MQIARLNVLEVNKKHALCCIVRSRKVLDFRRFSDVYTAYFMPPRSKSNVPQAEALRWNVEKASTEFGVARNTLKKILNQNFIRPDPDGLYTTRQLCEGLFGSMHVEKLATQKEIREKLQLENQITRGQMLSRSELAKGLAQVADAMVCRIAASELSRSAKEDLLKELAGIPLMLKDVAHKS
jgi:hypothetical protein